MIAFPYGRGSNFILRVGNDTSIEEIAQSIAVCGNDGDMLRIQDFIHSLFFKTDFGEECLRFFTAMSIFGLSLDGFTVA